MNAQINNAAQTSAIVNGIAPNAPQNQPQPQPQNDTYESRWNEAKAAALEAWQDGGACSVDAILKGGNLLKASHDDRAVKWFSEMAESADPMIKAGASKSLLILEAFFFGEQKTNGTIEVPAGAPKAVDREPKAWQKRSAYWATRRDYIALAWSGELKVRRGVQKRTDDERLQQAARVIARLIKNKKCTMVDATAAIDEQLAALKAKAAK